MKKSKIFLAITLAVILAVTCGSVPSFSWFTRPQNQKGEKMLLNTKNAYTAYNGKGVTISTESSQTGVFDESDTTKITCSESTHFSVAGSGSNTGISSFNRKYFCTTITNGSGTEQNVSLYARTLSIPTSGNGTLALGVNGPTRNYRDYTALATPSTKTTSNSMRIYFEKDNKVDGWNGTDFYICWNEDTNTSIESLNSVGSNGTYYKMTHVGGGSNPNQYYADIPKTATHAFFCVENWGTNDNNHPKWSQRSNTLYDLAGDGQTQTNSLLFKITSGTSSVSDDNGSHTVHTLTKYNNIIGNCINTYYSSIFVAKNDMFDARLDSSEYIGDSLEYYASPSDGSIFKVTDQSGTINKNGGFVSAVNGGVGYLFTKSVGGSYPDSQEVKTTVYVTDEANYEFHDVPIVKNIKIPAENNSTDEHEGEIKVYWYVINNSATTKLRYNIDEIYVGL